MPQEDEVLELVRLPSDDFVRRALSNADLNALRIALYQATGDESLVAIELVATPMNGGANTLIEVAEHEREALKEKAIRFLRSIPADFEEVKPQPSEVRRLMEALRGEPLSDKDFAFRRDIPAFEDYPHTAKWAGEKPTLPVGFEVAIIGAGVSGIAMGVQLETLNIPYVVYERRPRLGGTWQVNTYPDVRVDVPNLMYEYTFEKKYRWSEYFAQGAEVRSYVEHVAKKHGVYPHIIFNSEVTSAVFDELTGKWSLGVTRDGKVERRTVNAIVAATGLFATPKQFDAEGVEDFQGTIVHSTEWTGNEVYEGRDVAIIGNGSSGVQMLRPFAEKARQVYVMQRSAQWMAPFARYGDQVAPETQWLLDTMPYYWNWNTYSYIAARLTLQLMQEIDPEWQKQGGIISKPNDSLRASLTTYIQSKLGDRPDLMAKVMPKDAPWARRMIVDNQWYESLRADNVELVTEGIERLTSTGIRTVDGTERAVDLIVTATGFAVTKYLWPTRYIGLGGADLHERWDDPESEGPRAYLGMTVPDFPNLFIMYGPNSQQRSGSIILWFEIWSHYIGEALIALIEGGHRYANVREDVFEEYNNRLDRDSKLLIWMEEASVRKNYYVNSFGRQQVNMPWRVEDAYVFFEHFDPSDYEVV